MSKLELYDRVKKATVAIVVEIPNRLPQKPFTIIGSGFCIHSAGIIVTCEHVFRAFFDERAYKEILKELPEVMHPRLIQHGHINRQPQVMFLRGIQGTQVLMPVIGITEAITKLGFDVTLFKLPKHGEFPNGYPTIEIADYSELHEMQEIAICGFPLGGDLFNQLGTVTSSFTTGRISSIIPLAGLPASHVKGYQLDLTTTTGNSGGPVFSLESGKVFAVLQGGVIQPGSNSILQGVAKAEPIHPAIEDGVVQRLIDGTHRPPGL
jgi:S1-C subfamily serine protease